MELTARNDVLSFRFRARNPAPAFATIRFWRGMVFLSLFAASVSLRAALQFDVFLGYGGQPTGTDGIIREAGWFPVACEVLNDGPPFNAVFELATARGQTTRFAVELPTNTRKRFVLPVFAGSGTYAAWDARLLDDRGRIRAEKTGLRPRGMSWESILLGGVPRTFGGLPKLPELRGNNNRLPSQPLVARLQVELLPGDPISLEGLDALYLNSEKALELKVDQVSALLTWIHGGGHLIVGVEQPSDVNATPWLRALLPIDFKDVATRRPNQEIHAWLRERLEEGRQIGSGTSRNRQRGPGPGAGGADPYTEPADDAEFSRTDFAVATGALRDGKALLSVQQAPLIVTARRGRGEVTVLTFSPEREPFRSWKSREWFWAKLLGIPARWFGNEHLNFYGGWSSDGVFGAMIDSRQVRKLPVHWLLLLLVVYLLVIGPVDQYCLKKAGKQMLTWVTFPCYVVFFSLLIYYIGYRLRAGETEWNELHIVDLLPHGERAEWRGRTYASVYSPINAHYKLEAGQSVATLRGEFMGANAGGQEGSKAEVWQRDRGFDAEIFVPVWTSQLYVSDWEQSGENAIAASVVPQGKNWRVSIRNQLPCELRQVRLALQDRLYDIGNLPSGGNTNRVLEPSSGIPLRDFVMRQGSQFQQAVQQRQYAFGDDRARWLELNSSNVTAVSFVSQVMNMGPNQRGFVYPAGLDVWPVVERGDAVLLAWVPDYSPAGQPLNRFKTIRSQRNTLFRLAIPVGQPGNP